MKPHPPPRSPSSHDRQPGPTLLLAVVCLTIVHRVRPQWLAVTISEATQVEQLNAERVSRLCARVLPAFESTLGALTRIGRPPRAAAPPGAHDPAQELAITRSLLAVATSLLAHVSLRARTVRPLILGAWLRLSAELPALTQKQFCHTLGLSPRTLRAWLVSPPAASPTPAAPTPPPRLPSKRPPRRRRFAFDVVLPDTQLAADTTDLEALGISLKLIATQDIGGRDHDLLDSVIVDDQESAAQVIAALRAAIDDREGFQVVVDQGTPYMAEATRAALEQLGAEHAPQREGTPTDKATIERAFRSVKTYAGPLLALSTRIAALLPQLRRPELAKALTTLVLTALLRAYQGGARATERADTERAGLDRTTLAQVATQARQDARVHDQSLRQRLQWIHQAYGFEGCATQFVRTFRRFPLPVIEQAEAAFGAHAARPDITHRTAYFAAIVRRFHDAHRARLLEQQRQHARDRQERRHIERLQAERRARHANPLRGLHAALDILPAYWDAHRQTLLYDGLGPGRVGARTSIARLTELYGAQAAIDITTGALQEFARAQTPHLDPAAIDAIDRLVRRFLPPVPTLDPTPTCLTTFASTILRSNGQRQHPPPS
jgi:transposase InsO family protein